MQCILSSLVLLFFDNEGLPLHGVRSELYCELVAVNNCKCGQNDSYTSAECIAGIIISDGVTDTRPNLLHSAYRVAVLNEINDKVT